MDSNEFSKEDLQEIQGFVKASETSDESDDLLDMSNDETEGNSICHCGSYDKFSVQRDIWTCRECGRTLEVGFNTDKTKQTIDKKDIDKKCVTKHQFCLCGNSNETEVEEVVTAKETIWRCKLCGQGLGVQECKQSSKVLCFDSSPLDSIHRNDTTVKLKLGCNTSTAVKLQNKGHKDGPDRAMSSEGFCPCGDNDGQQIEEQYINGETYWKCKKCLRGIGDGESKRSVNSATTITHSASIIRNNETPGEQAMVSSSTFYDKFCSCDYSGDNAIQEVIDGQTTLKCKKCSRIIKLEAGRDDKREPIQTSDIPKGTKPTHFDKTTFENLIEGDHIKWKEYKLDPVHREGIINLIDYTKTLLHVVWNKPKPLPFAQVEETGLICTKKSKVTLSKAVYNCSVLPADQVIVRALSRRGEKKYNPVNNNTRQFPVWCKTNYGSKVPLQSVPIKESKQESTKNIEKFKEFTVGMHIKFTRGPIYDHHAIVYDVHAENQEITVAHYSTKEWPDGILKKISKIFAKGKLAEIMLERLKWNSKTKCLLPFMESDYVQTDLSKNGAMKKTTRESVHKVLYSGPIYPAEIILEKARERLGETSYSLMRNNCEHFASECCTGSGKSTQVEALKRHILTTLGSVSLVATVEGLQLLLSELPSLPVGFESAVSITDNFFIFAENLLPVSVIGVVLQCLIMIIIKGIKIYRIMGQFKNGKITKHDRNRKIGAEIAEGVISSGLALLLGVVLGYLVPIPILVNVIGALLGYLIGRGIGKILQHYLFKKGFKSI